MLTAFARTAQLARAWPPCKATVSHRQPAPHAENLAAAQRSLEDWARHGGGLIDHGQAGLSLPTSMPAPQVQP